MIYHDAIHELFLLPDRRDQAAAAAGSVLHGIAVVVVVGGRAVVRTAVEGVAGDQRRGGNLLTPDRDGHRAEIVI